MAVAVVNCGNSASDVHAGGGDGELCSCSRIESILLDGAVAVVGLLLLLLSVMASLGRQTYTFHNRPSTSVLLPSSSSTTELSSSSKSISDLSTATYLEIAHK